VSAPAPARRRALLRAGLLGLLGGAAGDGHAQPLAHAGPRVRLTVAYPPGGVSDETARELATLLHAPLGVPVIVEHRPGAGGAVAMEALARARADGSELCFCAITPLLQLPHEAPPHYDPARDIAPVAAVMRTPVLVVATPAFRGERFADLVAAARREPGRLRWATSGHGTTGHRVLEQVAALAGVEITHVPYSGGGQQITDALAGHFELLSSNVAARQLAYVRAGRLRALAVGAPQRLQVLPDVPTLQELGYGAANLSSLFGVFAPGRTAPARLDALNQHINAAAAQPGFRQHLLDSGNLPAPMTRAAFAERIASEGAALRRLLAPHAAVGR
jgi:tripartite-type tricarboxylate transporter receptor subunit TctC